MRAIGEGWEFDVSGTGFKATLRVDLSSAPRLEILRIIRLATALPEKTMSIFSQMQPAEAAAWVSGSFGAIVTLINVFLARRGQAQKEHHELSIEKVRAEFNRMITDHKAMLEKSLNHELEQLRVIVPLQQKIREHLARSRLLLGKVYVSFHRLAKLAPSLDEEHILIETANTMDLYAEYRQHLAADEYVSYPRELQQELTAVQKTLARIFLDLQIDESSRNDQAVTSKIKASLRMLLMLRDRVTSKIEELMRIPLTSMSDPRPAALVSSPSPDRGQAT
jgi:hypothetical protein